ncbi:hypothetical protein [Lactococcus cremoris]|uniref:hypothetical protein n=1 Tax=Lactococcus lactis subsp. cremoris TaxID=1359 RepID=UPI0005825041|nr:hypothetical protein [Lactococcus cremoris]KGH33973.1 hypothetical protein JL36_04240 [Lactococcus cremoris]QSE64091.1 hypothetical protein JWR96_02910 [Lactococcus cremoris]
MTVIFKEIEDFNNGDRDSIFILKSSLNKIKRGHSMLDVGALGTLVVDSPQKIHEYTDMANEYGEDYALGVILGYPPKCVLRFSRASRIERKDFGILSSGSFSFMCPEELKDYAVNYMKDRYGLESRFIINK